MVQVSETIFDTHSTMTPDEVDAYNAAITGRTTPPPEDGRLSLTFTVTCPTDMEDLARDAFASALDALGLHDRHYRRGKAIR